MYHSVDVYPHICQTLKIQRFTLTQHYFIRKTFWVALGRLKDIRTSLGHSLEVCAVWDAKN